MFFCNWIEKYPSLMITRIISSENTGCLKKIDHVYLPIVGSSINSSPFGNRYSSMQLVRKPFWDSNLAFLYLKGFNLIAK